MFSGTDFLRMVLNSYCELLHCRWYAGYVPENIELGAEINAGEGLGGTIRSTCTC